MHLLQYSIMFLVLFTLKMINGNKEVMNYPGNSLSGKVMKVVVSEFPPHSQAFRNATGHVIGYGGLLVEHLKWLSPRLNFSLDMEPAIDSSYGILKNGNWTGIRGQLQRKEVDLACIPLTGTSGYEVFELAVYIEGDAFGIFVKYPTPHTSIDGPIAVFSLNVWIGLFITMIACAGFIQLLAILGRKYVALHPNYRDVTFGNTVYFIFGTLTNHNVPSPNGSRSLGIMTFFWLLATFVFVNVYSSCMSSYMSMQFQRPDIATLEDLANSRQYLPTTIKDGTAANLFKVSKSTKMKKLDEKLKQCTVGCNLLSIDAMIQNALDGHFAALVPITSGAYYMKKTISQRQCRLTMGQESMAFLNYFLGVPKNSPYVMELNKASYWWGAVGLHRYWVNKLMSPPRQCLLEYNNKGESVQVVERVRLKLEQFTVAFAVLFIGYTLALLQFIRERFILRGRP